MAKTFRKISDLYFKIILQENITEHLISIRPASPSKLPFIYDVSSSLGYIFEKFVDCQSSTKVPPLDLSDIIHMRNSLGFCPDMEGCISLFLKTYFSRRPDDYFKKLFWFNNPEFFFELRCKDELSVSKFTRDKRTSYQLLLRGPIQHKVISASTRDALIKMMIQPRTFEHFCKMDAFSLTDQEVLDIHNRKCVGNIPYYDHPEKRPRLIELKYVKGNLGLSITGGQLICTSDDRYYQKYEYSPIFIDEVDDVSHASSSGLLVHDKIIGINHSCISGLDFEVVKHIIEKSLASSDSLVLSVVYSPQEFDLYQNLIEFYHKSKKEFDPKPLSDHPLDIARGNKRPLWIMGKQKKIRTL